MNININSKLGETSNWIIKVSTYTPCFDYK